MIECFIRKAKIYTPCLLILLSARLGVAQTTTTTMTTTTTTKPKQNHGYFDCGDERVNNVMKGSKYNTSKIKHSGLEFSTVVCSFVAHSTLESSKVINTELIDVKVLKHSDITRSTLEDSDIMNSTIENSSIHDSKIQFSIIKDHPKKIIDCCYKNCIVEGATPAKDMEGEVLGNDLCSKIDDLTK